MPAPNLIRARWRKSSYSASNGGDCVEVARTLHAVRDSKNPTGPALAVAVDTFVRAVKAGLADR